MEHIYYWLVIYLGLLWFAGEIVWGFVCTCSWVRWVMVRSKLHNEPLHWSKFPKSFFSMWRKLIGHRVGNTELQSSTGTWRGVGKWTAYKADNT